MSEKTWWSDEESPPRTAVATRSLVEAIAMTGGWQAAYLWCVEEHPPLIRCRELWHDPLVDTERLDEASARVRFIRGDGLAGHVWRTEAPAWIETIEDNDQCPRFPIAWRMGMRTACAVPLRAAGRIVGVLEVFGISSRAADPLVLQAMAVLGQQLAELMIQPIAEGHWPTFAEAPIVLISVDDTQGVTVVGGCQERHSLGLGYGPGGTLIDALGHLPELCESCRLALAGQEHTAVFSLPDGTAYEGRFVPQRGHGGQVKGMVAAVMEVTEQQELDAAVRQREAGTVVAERSEALGAVGQQIDLLLAPLRGAVAQLMEVSKLSLARKRRLLSRVERGLRRIDRLATELRRFVRDDQTAAARPGSILVGAPPYATTIDKQVSAPSARLSSDVSTEIGS